MAIAIPCPAAVLEAKNQPDGLDSGIITSIELRSPRRQHLAVRIGPHNPWLGVPARSGARPVAPDGHNRTRAGNMLPCIISVSLLGFIGPPKSRLLAGTELFFVAG